MSVIKSDLTTNQNPSNRSWRTSNIFAEYQRQSDEKKKQYEEMLSFPPEIYPTENHHRFAILEQQFKQCCSQTREHLTSSTTSSNEYISNSDHTDYSNSISRLNDNNHQLTPDEFIPDLYCVIYN
ncbi:hypothetical protein GJ496_009464 [Pomphorhynchus laevis]|nr:hypothetical protein GJ496_009464 [Pomphorhynchus laevis]